MFANQNPRYITLKAQMEYRLAENPELGKTTRFTPSVLEQESVPVGFRYVEYLNYYKIHPCITYVPGDPTFSIRLAMEDYDRKLLAANGKCENLQLENGTFKNPDAMEVKKEMAVANGSGTEGGLLKDKVNISVDAAKKEITNDEKIQKENGSDEMNDNIDPASIPLPSSPIASSSPAAKKSHRDPKITIAVAPLPKESPKPASKKAAKQPTKGSKRTSRKASPKTSQFPPRGNPGPLPTYASVMAEAELKPDPFAYMEDTDYDSEEDDLKTIYVNYGGDHVLMRSAIEHKMKQFDEYFPGQKVNTDKVDRTLKRAIEVGEKDKAKRAARKANAAAASASHAQASATKPATPPPAARTGIKKEKTTPKKEDTTATRTGLRSSTMPIRTASTSGRHQVSPIKRPVPAPSASPNEENVRPRLRSGRREYPPPMAAPPKDSEDAQDAKEPKEDRSRRGTSVLSNRQGKTQREVMEGLLRNFGKHD